MSRNTSCNPLSDVERFYKVQEERTNIADEDIEEYLHRRRQQRKDKGERDALSKKSLDPAITETDHSPQQNPEPTYMSDRKRKRTDDINAAPLRLEKILRGERSTSSPEHQASMSTPLLQGFDTASVVGVLPCPLGSEATMCHNLRFTAVPPCFERVSEGRGAELGTTGSSGPGLNATATQPNGPSSSESSPRMRAGNTTDPATRKRQHAAVRGSSAGTPLRVHETSVSESGRQGMVTKSANLSRATPSNRGGKVLKIPKNVDLQDPVPAVVQDVPSVAAIPTDALAGTSVLHTDVNGEKGGGSGRKGAARGKAAAKKVAPRKMKKIYATEYARLLEPKMATRAAAKPSPQLYLKGKRIFFVGADLEYASDDTKGKMDFIVRSGGTLLPTYSPEEVTHIVSDAPKSHVLRTLRIKSLEEIPEHIATVKWSWIQSGGRGLPSSAIAVSRKGKEQAASTDREDAGALDDIDDFEPYLEPEFMHASFRERIDAGLDWTKALRAPRKPEHGASSAASGTKVGRTRLAVRKQDEDGDSSRISEFTQDPTVDAPSRLRWANTGLTCHDAGSVGSEASINEVRSQGGDVSCCGVGEDNLEALREESSSLAHDPLAHFYAEARAERDAALLHSRDGDDETEDESKRQSYLHDAFSDVPRKRGFVCDTPNSASANACPNQDVIDKLEELRALHQAKPSTEDSWRVFSYGKAISALKSYPTRIRSFDEALAIRNIGDKTAQKITEIIETGRLLRIEYEKTEDIHAVNIFLGIYGVGRETAFKWFAAGCRSLEDIRARKGGIKLRTVQDIGLEHYDDINSRMPRSEAADIFDMIKPLALSIDSALHVEIMGSYRRGKADCGDIDILITRPVEDGNTHRGVLRKLLRVLHERDIVTEDLAVPDDFDELELVYRGLCRKDAHSRRRRIDILTVPYQSRGAALLYFTGDDIFNRSMRLKAHKMGYSLNQRGLFSGVVRNPSDRRIKTNDGTLIASETEKEIFEILGVPWQEPSQRVRS